MVMPSCSSSSQVMSSFFSQLCFLTPRDDAVVVFFGLCSPVKDIFLKDDNLNNNLPMFYGKFEVSLSPATGFFADRCHIFGKYVMQIFFLQYLNSCPPARTGIIRFGSKLTKN